MRRPTCLALALLLLLGGCTVKMGPAETADPTAAAAGPVQVQPTESPETASPAPQIIPSATAEPTPVPASPSPTPLETPEVETGELTVHLDGTVRTVPAEQREYILRESLRLSFSMMVPGTLVQPEYASNAWSFPLQPQGSGDGSAPAWLELSLISGTTAEELLPDFMSAYLSFTEIEFSGSSDLGGTTMDETITASGDSLLVKAWLLDVPQGVFAVVLCCAMGRLDPDLSYLEAMLETLSVAVEK